MAEKKGYVPLLMVLFAAAFVAAFNENIVNVGLSDVMTEFALDANTANWLVTGYMVVTAVVVTMVAFLLTRLNVRAVFFGGALLFVAGSVLALAAPTFPLLLTCRLLQAVGTGVFIPTMMNVVLLVAPRKKLGTYLSIGGCCITFGPAFGPVVTGLMITSFGWRSMFVVPACAMALVAVAGIVFVRNVGECQKARLDVLSLVLSAVGLTALVYGLSQITAAPLSALVALAVGLAVLALFVRRQGRVENPLLNLQPLRNPRFALACVLVVVAMMITFSMSVLLPLYFEGAAGTNALVAGALILVPILVNAGTAVLGGRIMDRRGEWPLLPAGFLLIAVGQVSVCLVAGSINLLWVVLASCVVYAGVGFIFSPSQTAGLKTLPPEQNPFGVGIMSTFIQVSAAVGPSLFVGVLSSTLSDQLVNGASEAQAQAAGFAAAIAVAAVIASAGAVVAFFYARRAVASDAPKIKVATAPVAPKALELQTIMKEKAYTVPAYAYVYEAIEIMLEHHTSGLPVIDREGTVVGFISDGDIMRTLADQDAVLVDLYYSLSTLANTPAFDERMDALMHNRVEDLATEHVISLDVETSIERVCTVLGEHHLKKAPVVRDGKLVGTVSRSDVNRYLLNAFVAKGRPAA